MIADDQHADLAQHQDADHVDDVDVGAEFAEMEDALLRDDAADQEGDQQDDRHRAPADMVEMMHHRGEAEAARARQRRAAARPISAPSMLTIAANECADRSDGLRRSRPARRSAPAAVRGGGSSELDAVQFVDQRAVVVLAAR